MLLKPKGSSGFPGRSGNVTQPGEPQQRGLDPSICCLAVSSAQGQAKSSALSSPLLHPM